jgi:hypothetical protein
MDETNAIEPRCGRRHATNHALRDGGSMRHPVIANLPRSGVDEKEPVR